MPDRASVELVVTNTVSQASNLHLTLKQTHHALQLTCNSRRSQNANQYDLQQYLHRLFHALANVPSSSVSHYVAKFASQCYQLAPSTFVEQFASCLFKNWPYYVKCIMLTFCSKCLHEPCHATYKQHAMLTFSNLSSRRMDSSHQQCSSDCKPACVQHILCSCRGFEAAMVQKLSLVRVPAGCKHVFHLAT